MPAQPEDGAGSPAGVKSWPSRDWSAGPAGKIPTGPAGLLEGWRPSQGLLSRPTPGKDAGPATEGTDRPSQTSTMPAQLLYMSAWAWLIRTGSIYSGLELLFTCFLIFLHI
jgi:hypothetical protein